MSTEFDPRETIAKRHHVLMGSIILRRLSGHPLLEGFRSFRHL